MIEARQARQVLVVLSVSRTLAMRRAILRLLAGAMISVVLAHAYGGLHFHPTATSNRLTDYAIALALVPAAALALLLLAAWLRWLLLSCWPGRIRLEFSAEAIEFHLGPFGMPRLDAQRLEIRYPHELDPEDSEQRFESYEDPDVQERTRLPRMTHPEYPGRVDWVIRRFVPLDEAVLAQRLRPFLEAARQEQPVRKGI